MSSDPPVGPPDPTTSTTPAATSPLALLDSAIKIIETPGVEFEILHEVGDAGERDQESGDGSWSTRYMTRMNGHNLHVRTQRSRATTLGEAPRGWNPREQPVIVDVRDIAVLRRGVTDEELRIHGSVVGEPDFLYEFRDQLDMLMTLGPLPAGADHGGRLSAALSRMTSSAATVAALPVTFVRAPASGFAVEQLPADGSDPDTDPMSASTLAVRMTVGLNDASDTKRLTLLRTLTEYAAEQGYGLYVSEGRIGQQRGGWITLTRPGAARRDPTDEPAPQRPGVIATIMGPNRQGSLVAVLEMLHREGLHATALSAMVWNDIAFVHVAAPAPPSWTWPFDGQTVAHTGAARGHVIVASRRVLVGERPGAHPVFATWEVRAVNDPPPSDLDTGAVLMSRSREVVRTVRGLADGDDRVMTAQVDLERHRPTPNGRISGRLKLSVWPRQAWSDPAATMGEICGDLQRWARLTVEAGTPLVVSLRVDWRERWLGARHDDTT